MSQEPHATGDGLVSNWAFPLTFFILAYAFFIYNSQPINWGGDPGYKWFEVRRLLHGLGYSDLDHHTLRWAINFPTLGFQYLFGTNTSVYYLVTSFFGALCVLFVYKTGELLGGSWLGFFAALTTMSATPIIDASSQLFPSIFICAYIFATTYTLLKFAENQSSSRYVFLALILFFCAYGSKVTSLYFLPAILIYLRYITSSWRIPTLFAAGFFALFVVEAGIIAFSSGEVVLTGRLGYMGKHLGLMEDKRYNLAGLYKRWNQLPTFRYTLLLGALVFSLFFTHKCARHKQVFLLTLLLVVYVLLMTYAITSIKPIRLAEPVRIRYILPTLPLTILICYYGLMKLGGRPLLVICTILILFAQWPSYESRLRHTIRTKNYFHIDEFQKNVNQYYEDGYGLVFGRRRHAKLYLSMYLNDEAVFCEKKKLCVDLDALPASELNVHDGPLYFYLIKKLDDVRHGYIVLSHRYDLDKVFTLEELERRRNDA